MKRAMIIMNPSSGKEEAEKNLPHVAETLQKQGFDLEIYLTEKECDALQFARLACKHSFDAVISMGGDGTLNEIINGLAEQEHRPSLGIIPLGTVNDFARALHIPLDSSKAVEVLKKEKLRTVDICKVNNKYFLNVLAVGEIAEASFSVSAQQKTLLGPLAYFMEGIKSLTSKQAFHVRLQHDKGAWEGEVLLILAALTNSVGGFEKIAPDAKVDDGLLKCMMIKDVSYLQFIKLVKALLKGEHINDPAVEYISTSALQIFSSHHLKANIDGDEGDRLPLNLKVLPGHLNIYVL
ncbi:hypothetical protein WQ54_04480 [Bacillus sp. SA1-12]|uniref:YegS/Rv2252/BmrU family lipid kinase n=1 Tax=Bacillus sp. SA1-12 TaxID=1455638 RepID=UPI00062632B7|nr:YegS/Rv2252/BmrU family lipid kinase [Bacillus sp. SA1-12]KKI93488.1 hypothetical protein WQ54_04480 [Bacillus sp. SA1-12]